MRCHGNRSYCLPPHSQFWEAYLFCSSWARDRFERKEVNFGRQLFFKFFDLRLFGLPHVVILVICGGCILSVRSFRHYFLSTLAPIMHLTSRHGHVGASGLWC